MEKNVFDHNQIDKQLDRIHSYPKTPSEVYPVSQFTATDLSFLDDLLPQYNIQVVKEGNGIRCRSTTGISDENKDREWNTVFVQIKKHFGKRFSEVFHSTCYNHIDFTIYLKKNK